MKAVLINDILGGCLGEKKVFWNYLLDGIPGLHGVEYSTIGAEHFPERARAYIDRRIGPCVIIQNATFLPRIHPNQPTIAFLQDNLRAMHCVSAQQEDVLRNAQWVVANSEATARWYPEYVKQIIPIGVDETVFVRQQVLRRTRPTGIFVGALNDVKGWPQVLATIRARPDVFFYVVSKDTQDFCQEPNVQFCGRVPQEQLVQLLSEADFFLLGSPVETQCLAALEANFCDVPVIMNQTGIYMDWDDRDSFGVFGQPFPDAIDMVLSRSWSTRKAILRKGLSIDTTVQAWTAVLASFGYTNDL